MASQAKFSVGDLVHHKLFDYRGVIVDLDPHFMLPEDWYEQMARSRPPKDQPWYRVLVHEAMHETYVAEGNLAADTSTEPILHPRVDEFFVAFSGGRYQAANRSN
ncbi:MAG: heat shock protein HspQ [Pseudohongiellaceae bacterium]